MKNRTRNLRVVALLLVLALLLSACTSMPLPPLFYIYSGASQPAQPANPAPAATVVAQAPEAVVEPTVAPTEEPTAVPAPTDTPTEAPTATAVPTETPTEAPTATAVPPTATPTQAAATSTPTRVPPTATSVPTRAAAVATATPEWPKTIVITEAEIEEMAASGGVPGLTITGLDVTFGNDTMTVFFESLKYGFISMRNVTVEGHFDVTNGVATFVADSISPRNLATTQIPGFVNQALGQQFSQWYVEDITITPGQLSASVSPRS
ncbi:MAG: hypothetical protein H6649_05535 [Caldilineae bacterium]|nr:hypothetical protein [Anaerolineae bacterium]MCB0203410.1 hypothetical protein [Anaerolineae bacterium]MCB0252195.1 hypothetical protein [Anaerolineae bacterium]MCB9153504.1 hypothetical protein [Caldilineae bacterium]